MMDFTPSGFHCKPDNEAGRAQFRERIEKAKQLLPLSQLIEQLGDSERVAEKRCPFHFPDGHPSFSVFWREFDEFWKCHAGCGSGDQIDYIRVKLGISRGEAMGIFLEMAGLADQGGGRFRK